MQDFKFDYNGDSHRIPKSKLFECLYEVGEVIPLLSINEVFMNNDFMKVAKVFTVLFSYTGKTIDPIEVTKHYLYKEGGAKEIFDAMNGAISLLNPPENYHPPETEEAGK